MTAARTQEYSSPRARERGMRHGLSLDPASWRKALELTNRNWKRVPFSRVQASMVPEKPGVYALCSGVPAVHEPKGVFARLYGALYVGQSDSLRRRFLQHNDRPKPEIVKAVEFFPSAEFWYLPLPREEIDSAEDALIDCLGPPGNLRRGIRASIDSAKARKL